MSSYTYQKCHWGGIGGQTGPLHPHRLFPPLTMCRLRAKNPNQISSCSALGRALTKECPASRFICSQFTADRFVLVCQRVFLSTTRVQFARIRPQNKQLMSRCNASQLE